MSEVSENLELDDVDGDVSDDETSVYVEYDIATYPSDLTLLGIRDMFKDGDIFVPKYQRSFVWSLKQASLLIESFLIGLPVPQVFFYVEESGKNQIIDGQQRIRSVVDFFDGYFGDEEGSGKRRVFRLEGLNKKSPYAKCTFDELSESDQRKLKSRVLRVINVRQLAPRPEATSVYHIFERLNTGGTQLKPQEIRNCVFNGEFVRILQELNGDVNWRKLIGRKNVDRQQKDIEMILRIFSMAYYSDEYDKPMKEFLNKSMEKNRSGDTENTKLFAAKFGSVCEAVLTELGEKPFAIRGRLNLSVLDSVMSVLIASHKSIFAENLKGKFEQLVLNPSFRESAFYNTSDEVVVRKRLQLARKFLA